MNSTFLVPANVSLRDMIKQKQITLLHKFNVGTAAWVYITLNVYLCKNHSDATMDVGRSRTELLT